MAESRRKQTRVRGAKSAGRLERRPIAITALRRPLAERFATRPTGRFLIADAAAFASSRSIANRGMTTPVNTPPPERRWLQITAPKPDRRALGGLRSL